MRQRDYEAFVVDQESRATEKDTSQDEGGEYVLPQAMLDVASKGQASHARRLEREGTSRFATSEKMGISLSPTGYAVVDPDSMSLVAGTSSTPSTYAQQAQASRRQTGALQARVVADHERTADYTPAA